MSGHERILNAAGTLFAANGVDGVSIREIAEAAGVSKATVFHHFESKEVLYRAVVQRCSDGIGELLVRLASQEDGDPLLSLAEYRQQDLAEMQSHADVVRLIMRELTLGRDDQSRQLAQQVFADHFSNLQRLMQQAAEQGAIRSDADSAVAAASMVSINVFLFLVWPVLRHLPDSPFEDIEQTSEAMFELLLTGLATQQGGKL